MHDLSMLTRLALTLGLVILLPKLMERMRLPGVRGERMLDDTWVNAVLVLVVATCVAGPILTERFARERAGDAQPS